MTSDSRILLGTHTKYSGAHCLRFFHGSKEDKEVIVDLCIKDGLVGRCSIGPVEFQPKFKLFSKKVRSLINKLIQDNGVRHLKKRKVQHNENLSQLSPNPTSNEKPLLERIIDEVGLKNHIRKEVFKILEKFIDPNYTGIPKAKKTQLSVLKSEIGKRDIKEAPLVFAKCFDQIGSIFSGLNSNAVALAFYLESMDIYIGYPDKNRLEIGSVWKGMAEVLDKLDKAKLSYACLAEGLGTCMASKKAANESRAALVAWGEDFLNGLKDLG